MQQRSEEWYQIRLGKVTASKISDIVAKTKTGTYAASREKYKAQLICERLTGRKAESFTNAAMQRGVDLEPIARQMYELETGFDVHEIAFAPHPKISHSGASPDGLVGDDGLIEIKCPETHTHIDFLRKKQPKHEYLLQMQWQMACTGRKWCDFVSYDDRLPEHLAYHTVRIERNDDLIAKLETEVIKFLAEIDDDIAELERE